MNAATFWIAARNLDLTAVVRCYMKGGHVISGRLAYGKRAFGMQPTQEPIPRTDTVRVEVSASDMVAVFHVDDCVTLEGRVR